MDIETLSELGIKEEIDYKYILFKQILRINELSTKRILGVKYLMIWHDAINILGSNLIPFFTDDKTTTKKLEDLNTWFEKELKELNKDRMVKENVDNPEESNSFYDGKYKDLYYQHGILKYEIYLTFMGGKGMLLSETKTEKAR